MESILARSAILELIHSLAWATDTLDRDLLLSLFLPGQTITLDASGHLSSLVPMQLLPEDLWEKTVAAIAGFTGTQHLLGNTIITFDKDDRDRAHAQTSVIAYHSIGTDGNLQSVTAHVIWRFDLVCHERRWYIRKFVIQRPIPLDNPKLYEIAQERYKNGEGRHVVV